MNALPGIGGTLFPGQFLVDGLAGMRIAPGTQTERLAARRRQLDAWWTGVSRTCGPATGLRAIFDVVALPLARLLGFRAEDVVFERGRARVRLAAPVSADAAMLILPWASRPSTAWRDVSDAARAVGARWCFQLSPPHLSLIDVRGHVCRRSIDFTLPDAFGERSFPRFWTLARAGGLATLDGLVADAARFQDRVRADLQEGVIEALGAFGGVLGRGGDGLAIDEALTLVYRLLFLLFAESRDLVPRAHPIYGRAYAVGAFCRTALGPPADAAGLWDGLAAITRLARTGCRVDDLIVRPFNGRLFARASAPSLEAGPRRSRPTRGTMARDAAMRRALVALSTRPGRAGREHISYADLGVEQLGAVYERVLDVDRIDLLDRPRDRAARPARQAPARAAGHSLRRKQTGTFYTPQPLAEFVVRRTLAPLVANAASSDAILSLRVVDPAMGSGAFLVAACRYLASACARAMVDEGRCAESDLDDQAHADIRRLVAERCLAGVDANPTAVQLARLSLWLTTLARGRPLGFLDHRLRTGNSLIGVSPDDLGRIALRRGRAPVASMPLFDAGGLDDAMRLTTRPLLELSGRRDDTVEDVRAKEIAWTALAGAGSPLHPWRQASNLWCARWFTARPPAASELRAAIDAVLKGDRTLPAAPLARWRADAEDAARRHGFFHWPLEFADVFYDDTGGPKTRPGFDAVIGNPPWEMMRSDERPAQPEPEPRTPGTPDPRNLVSFIRHSGLFPRCDRGHLNLYQPFLERSLALTRPGGRVGLILPWGLASDDGAAGLRRMLVDESGLDTIVGLDNAGGLFPIHRGLRFMVVVARPGTPDAAIRGRFGVRSADEIDALPDRDDHAAATAYPVRLTPASLRAIGGRAARIPDLRHPQDLALLEQLVRRHPALGDSDGWSARFGRELNATEDRDAFGAPGAPGAPRLPVIEGKHVRPFAVDVAAATHGIARREAERRLPGAAFDRPRLGYRDVSGVANRVSLIAALLPAGVVSTHTVFCLRGDVPIERQYLLCGLFNSFVLNTVARLLMGGHLTTSLVEGLPAPAWTGGVAERRIARLARALARTADAPRMHAALQAAVARLYGLDRAQFAHVLRGFPLVPEPERRAALDAFTGVGVR